MLVATALIEPAGRDVFELSDDGDSLRLAPEQPAVCGMNQLAFEPHPTAPRADS